MALVAAICTQCGAQIQVDNTHEAGICKYCGTAFITEKVINHYTTYITNHNNFSGANINMNIANELEQIISAAKGFQRLKEYNKALEIYKIVIEKFPQDVRGWIGCISTINEGDFFSSIPSRWDTDFLEKEPFSRWFQNACLLADEDVKNQLEHAKVSYKEKINQKWIQFNSKCSLDGLKDFIGNDTYIYETDFGTQKKLFYIRNNKLYYQYYQGSIEGDHYRIYEIVSINDNKTMFAKSYFEHSNETLQLYNYENSIIILSNQLDKCNEVFHKSNDPLKLHIEVAWDYEYKRQELNNKINKKGCYIATCVYGSYDCPQVWTLRRFRDYILGQKWYGRIFIKYYYTISPILVKWFGNQKWIIKLWKKMLDIMVSKLNNRGIENTYYED